MIRLQIFAVAALFSTTTGLQAADFDLMQPSSIAATEAQFSWTGAYFGLNGGLGSGEGASVFTIGGNAYYGGPIIGMQAGYNFGLGNAVLGFEADYQFADVKHRRDLGLGIWGVAGLNSFGTLRARAGADMGTFMPFVTAGVAYGSMGYNIQDLSLNDSTNAWGWTAGGGIEAAVTDNASIKAEYLYLNLDGGDVSLAGFDVDMNSFAHVARAGVNFHF